MSGRRNNRAYFLIFFVAFSLIFSPINFSFFLSAPAVEGQMVPVENITGSVVWSENRTVQGIISVPLGATLTIQKGVVVEFDEQSQIEVLGRLIIEGTPTQPVVLRKKDTNEDDFYTVRAVSSGSISVRNASVSGGGSAHESFMVLEPSLFRRVHAAWFYSGAFSAVAGGTLDIEGVNFHDNVLAVHTDASSYTRTKVWRSKFADNNLDFVNESSRGGADVRYNWWGNEDGAALCVTECEDRPRTYEKIIGGANSTDWARSEDFKDPVIVLPGIMGSWRWTHSGDLVLDPILDTYDELVETLHENGYARDENLFLFPYEWRISSVDTARLLREKIDEIKAVTRWPKVDIVAHSMGGLVAREYIGTLNGGRNVDQLVTLGTPHDGSPKSYLTWEGGEFGVKLRDFLLERVFQQEAEENGYDSVFDYVRQGPITSVRELLPTSSYLRDQDTGEMRTYPTLYPRNTFIENLKTSAALNRLSPVLFTNIVGRVDENETITALRVEGASIELLENEDGVVLWGHGKPDGYDDLVGDRGLELGDGDGTVPFVSVTSILADETVELESNHGDLPTDAARTVVKTLTGLDAISSGTLIYPPNSLLLVMPFSPIDIQVVSPSGLRVGKNFENGETYNEIPGAFYTGHDTENEFVTIPNPEEGKYTILTEGTENGEYRIEAVIITEGDEGEEAKESVATFTGTAVIGVSEEKKIILEEDTVSPVEEEGADSIAPEIVITTPSNKMYLNSEIVPITYIVTDNVSTTPTIQTMFTLDGNVFTEASIDLSLQALGAHTLSLQATDEAGNQAIQSVDFTSAVTFSSLSINIEHYRELGLIKKKGDAAFLQASLRHLASIQEGIEKMKHSALPKKTKNFLITGLQRRLEMKRAALFEYLEKRTAAQMIDILAKERIREAVTILAP